MDRRKFLNTSCMLAGATGLPSLSGAAGKPPTESLSLSAVQAVNAMRRGELSAEAYATALIDRAQETARLNAFRTLDRVAVLEAARAADKARKAGRPLGRLHGLPVPVKDSVNTKQFPTTNGTAALSDFRPTADAPVVRALLNEGAIVMGKANMHELSFGWTGGDSATGPVHNPYDAQRAPGGSSSGSGVAVAVGAAPLAVAEDSWGSIRLPAAFCGIAGLRATYGRYPVDGVMPMSDHRFDQVGPVARSVEDLVLFDGAVTRQWAKVQAQPLKGVRVGISREFLWEGLDPEVERVVTAGLARLKDAGATLVEVPVPEAVKSTPEVVGTIISYEVRQVMESFLQAHGAPVSFDQLFAKAGAGVKASLEYLALPPNRPGKQVFLAALEKQARIKAELANHFRQHRLSLLAFPAAMTTAPRLGEEAEVDIQGRKVPLAVALARNAAMGSCAGMASLVLPAGLAANGLPVALEFAALPGRDRDLLGIGLSLEAALGPLAAPRV